VTDLTKVILVRHGETDWNKNARFQGQTDVPLSETGRGQAERVAEKLADEKVFAIYSSDLSRAYETASIIAKQHGLEVKKSKALREINFGLWEGMDRQVITDEHRDLYQQWLDNPMETRTPQGENFIEVQSRALTALREIASEHPNETVIVVAHGGLIKAVICEYLDGGFWEFPQGNTAVNILEYKNGDFRFVTLNDLSHLD
jgi:alpha-ribazole phosphatase